MMLQLFSVAPSWVYEPQDVSALLGTQILVHCATKGYPEPRVIWLKGHGRFRFFITSRKSGFVLNKAD